MSVECPASGCDYSGYMDAVEGHIGGVNDAVHRAVVKSDLRKSLDGEGSTGGFWTPFRVLLVVLVGLLLVGVLMEGAEETVADSEEEETDA